MSIDSIIIRTNEQLENMNTVLIDALDCAINSNMTIPLIYQFLHDPNKELIIDSDNKIGEVRNIRKDKKGDYIGDVQIYSILKLASNYQGYVDNIAASFKPQTNEVSIDAFIIYDMEAKEKILAKKNGILSKTGEIPIMSQVGLDDMKEISDILMDEYNRLMSTQQSDNDKGKEIN